MKTLISTNPADDYQPLGEVEYSSPQEVRTKVTNAKNAQPAWRSLGVKARVTLLKKVSDSLLAHKEKIALLATGEMGMPISQTRQDVLDACEYFDWYLDHAEEYLSPEVTKKDGFIHTVYYEPIGVAAVIVPWNFPMSNVIWGIGQNLIVGNTVVLKTSGEIALTSKYIEEIIGHADLPKGVFSEVYGDGTVGDLLVHEDINLITFTGSTAVGKRLYRIASEKFIKTVMELGGSAPGIVYADADVDRVLETIYSNRFTACGQMCDALKRLIVHEDRFEEVVEKLKKKLRSIKFGDPQDESTDMGPLVSQTQLELLEKQVEEAKERGARVVTGGKRPDGRKGAWYEPTLLTHVSRDMKVWREEVFGPVLPVVSFKTDEEAIILANDTKYGLGAYVFTRDKEKAKKIAAMIDAGMVSVNTASYVCPHNPFGGYKESGMGREHGKYGFYELTQIKVVSTEE